MSPLPFCYRDYKSLLEKERASCLHCRFCGPFKGDATVLICHVLEVASSEGIAAHQMLTISQDTGLRKCNQELSSV